MKIKSLHLLLLRNDEHFQYFTEFKTLVEKFNPTTLKIKPLFEDFLKRYAEEDEALLVVRKSSLTASMNDADAKRDLDFRGFADTIKAAQRHFNPQVSNAADKVQILLNTVGNVAPLPHDQETSKIYNLIQELRSPAFSNEISLMKLEDWVNQFEKSNQAFEALSRQRIAENAQLTDLKAKQTRLALDTQYKAIITRLQAWIDIGDDEATFKPFLTQLNILIDKYRNLLAQRYGRNHNTNNTQTPTT